MNRSLALGFAILVTALAPAAAQASTVAASGTQLLFTATPGVANDVTVATGAGYVISDAAGPVTAGTGCSQTTVNSVTCTTGGISTIRLNLDDGDDTTTVTANQNVVVFGGLGNDTLNGGPQGDQLYGEDGNDTLVGGTGPDLLDGGNDFDSVSYAGRTAALHIDLDGQWDDGENSSLFNPELDNVQPNVEDVTGGSGDDVFVGTAGANVFHGGDGQDTIYGLDGADTLHGDGGNDTIDGGYGTDTVDGGLDADNLMTRDNGVLDHVTCGGGTDSLVADREDDVAAGCESVDVPALPPAPPAADPPAAPKPDPEPAPKPDPKPTATPPQIVTIVQRTLEVSPKGKIPVKIVCGIEQKHGCKGTIKIEADKPSTKPGASRRSGPAKGGKVVVARGKFKVKRGKTALARVSVSRKTMKKSFGPKVKRVNATLTVSMKNSDGSTTQLIKPVTISTTQPKT